MKNLRSTLFLSLLLVVSMGFAQETAITDNPQTTNFSEYDTNTDAGIDRNEFNDRYGQDYNQWDMNRDGNVDQREFNDYTFDRLDTDRDRNLSQAEWERGYDEIYGDYLGDRDYERYDLDTNQNISYDEFDRSMRDTYYYSDYDTTRDRRIDSDELNEGVFNNMDRNWDGTIDETEYNATGSYYTPNISPTTN